VPHPRCWSSTMSRSPTIERRAEALSENGSHHNGRNCCKRKRVVFSPSNGLGGRGRSEGDQRCGTDRWSCAEACNASAPEHAAEAGKMRLGAHPQHQHPHATVACHVPSGTTSALADRLAPNCKPPKVVLPTDVGKAQEIERLRFPFSPTSPVLFGEPAEFDPARLIRVKFQPKLSQSPP
jgi:hypothetical protein